jgi:ppGpp synthetase/RelA/SpoT-type nucleotidyltranferase
MISKTQIDKLGDRLRKADITEADLRTLDEYRRSFSGAYEFVVGAIREELDLEPTGRPAKSTTAITEKLLRESMRLTQVQDIAGCRLIVPNVAEQDRVLASIIKLFENTDMVDRRKRPSHGYRAVHVIVTYAAKIVEIQVRTSLQHLWAELSEKLSDVFDPAIKYGGGDPVMVRFLSDWSVLLAQEETQEVELAALQAQVVELVSQGTASESKRDVLIDLHERISQAQINQTLIREAGVSMLREAIDSVPIKGEGDAVSD